MEQTPPDEHTIVKVGQVWLVEGHGEREITGITVCLQPQRDPAGELFGLAAEEIELGLPFTVDLEGGFWAYKSQLRRCLSDALAG